MNSRAPYAVAWPKPTPRKAARLAAGLLSCLMIFCFLFIQSGALTLERPSVDVDWNRVQPAQQNRPKLIYAKNRLFGTVEFRSPIKDLAQWERILRLYANRTSIDEDFAKAGQSAETSAWYDLKARAGGMSRAQLLEEVNKFFNRWPYRSDLDVYGLVDYWATPEEFINRSGDCEDYAIIKMFALIQLGVNPEDMRVVMLKDRIRNVDHAILAVYEGEEIYVLDNTTPLVLPHSRYGHYQPVISVNLFYKWAHVLPAK